MKPLVLAAMLAFLSFNAHAGFKTKLAIGAAGFIFQREILPAISIGVGMKTASIAVKRLMHTPIGKNMVSGSIAFYIITSGNSFVGQKSI